MREILFKAKRISDGEWVEGYYVEQYGSTQIYLLDDDSREYEFDCVHIDKNTLCQYTGLTDKNGNKIWENDVVKCQGFIGRIGWNKTHLAYTILVSVDGNMRYFYIDESLSSDIEVIGNIFDNPELMEEVQNEDESRQTLQKEKMSILWRHWTEAMLFL